MSLKESLVGADTRPNAHHGGTPGDVQIFDNPNSSSDSNSDTNGTTTGETTTNLSSSSSSSFSPNNQVNDSGVYSRKRRNNNLGDITLEDVHGNVSIHDDRSYHVSKPITLIESKARQLHGKIIKVGFPVFGKPMSYLNPDGTKDGLTFQAWKLIEPAVKEKFNAEVEYIVIKEPTVSKVVDGLKNGLYDVVIGDYGTNMSYSDDITYTASFMAIKDVGVYMTDSDTHLEMNLIKKVGSILYRPFIGLIILSILFTLYVKLFSSSKTSYSGAFLQMLNGILGDRSGLFSGPSYSLKPSRSWIAILLGVFMVVVTFLYLFYLQSIAITKSIQIISKNQDPFLYPRGKKVLLVRGSPAVKSLRTCCDIITVESETKVPDVDSIANEFKRRAEKENLIGFYHHGPEVSHWISEHPEFTISDTHFSVPSPVSFMIHKRHSELLMEINDHISKMNWTGHLNSNCRKYINRVCFASQF
jgi:hypothetical protein